MTVEVGVLYIQCSFCCTFMLSQNQLITGGDRPMGALYIQHSYFYRHEHTDTDISVCVIMTVEVGVLYIQCSLGLSPPVIR
jgi:hypothetical protein